MTTATQTATEITQQEANAYTLCCWIDAVFPDVFFENVRPAELAESYGQGTEEQFANALSLVSESLDAKKIDTDQFHFEDDFPLDNFCSVYAKRTESVHIASWLGDDFSIESSKIGRVGPACSERALKLLFTDRHPNVTMVSVETFAFTSWNQFTGEYDHDVAYFAHPEKLRQIAKDIEEAEKVHKLTCTYMGDTAEAWLDDSDCEESTVLGDIDADLSKASGSDLYDTDTGSHIPYTDPRQWHSCDVTEHEVGPWHYDDSAGVADWCDELCERQGLPPLTRIINEDGSLDFEQTFSDDGPNSRQVDALDHAEWNFHEEAALY